MTVGSWAKLLRAGIAGLAIAVLAGCFSVFDPSAVNARYRLDVTFQIEGRPVTASSVYELLLRSGGGDGSGTMLRVVSRLKGQAIVLPLPGHPTLIVPMLASDERGFEYLFLRSCGLRISDGETVAAFFVRVEAVKGPCPVDINSLRILGIAQPNRPETLKLADNRNLPAVFGTDIRLVSASISPSSAPVTRGIRTQLPWVLQYGQAAPADYVLPKLNIGVPLSSNIFSLGDN